MTSAKLENLAKELTAINKLRNLLISYETKKVDYATLRSGAAYCLGLEFSGITPVSGASIQLWETKSLVFDRNPSVDPYELAKRVAIAAEREGLEGWEMIDILAAEEGAGLCVFFKRPQRSTT